MTQKKNGGNGEDEEWLWRAATRGVKPLDKAEKKTKPAQGGVRADRAEKSSVRSAEVPARPIERAAGKADPALGLDKRTAEKIKKGKMPIEARIDLHGMSRARAHEALERFILQCHASQRRQVLVITGKGRAEDGGVRGPLDKGDGILKREVPQWLASPPLKALVLKVQPARPQHGGEGALYVYLRRAR